MGFESKFWIFFNGQSDGIGGSPVKKFGEETRGISNLSLLNFQSDSVCFNSDYHYHHHLQLYSSKKVQMQFLCGINIMFKFEHPNCESLV
ncbi:hypothetical protein NC653_035521 [Populus alba x Populus x berolinensis]|uniref:Uncharacterized protein n=1 Tax=Populus alba x Populus x berolinensis TaxID=444605 RepID=A0AAD6LQC9_9ROSI|nr:hypothetical protein NC653_035521 [Populus alba x Populus x berolinensis]